VAEFLRILILEDNPADVDLIKFELEEAGLAFTSKAVILEEDYVRELQEFHPDIILSDYDLPKYNGLLALAEAKKRCPDIPFILVTGAVTEDRAIEILTQGAKDYVLKKRLEQRLGPAIRRATAEAEEHRARKQAEQELREAHRTLEERVEIRTAELQAEIVARKKMEEELRESEKRFRLITETIDEVFWMADVETGKTFYVSPSFERIWGRSRESLYESPRSFIDAVHEQDRQSVLAELEIKKTGKPFDNEYRIVLPDGTIRYIWDRGYPIRDDQGQISSYAGVAIDITERKRLERRQSLSVEILGIMNESLPLADTISSILTAIKRKTRFEAVGIRLRSGDDFPYFVQDGFSDDFIRTENTLTVRAQDGGLCKDEKGNVSLECTCGLVISGQTDPTNPLFTQGGSFWINNTLPLLSLSADQEPRINPRNRCIHEGFLSVALIPIRANRDIIGLLQLNDRKEGCFTLDMITFFEGLGSSIGIAFTRKLKE
jgi:PAS domain S-box-containing protein